MEGNYNIRQIISVSMLWISCIIAVNHIGFFGINVAQPISLIALVAPMIIMTKYSLRVAGFCAILFAVLSLLMIWFKLAVSADIFALYAYFFLTVIFFSLIVQNRTAK